MTCSVRQVGKAMLRIHIKFTGMRPGEKLAEILESGDEKLMKTIHPKIFVSKIAPYPSSVVQEMTGKIPELCRSEDDVSIRKFLAESLPEAQISIKPGKARKTQEIIVQRFETVPSKTAAI